MDTAQWRPQQGIGLLKGVESSERQQQVQVAERRVRPQKTQPLNCPRCDSANTKFCYYNNYSLSQPRYFCKTCRRYWTEGGTLRNVPVGGGSRKNKRSSSSSSSSSSPFSTPTLASSTTPATKTTISLPSSSSTNPLPSHELNHLAYKFGHGGHDLNLSFPNQTLGGHELGGGSLPAFELLRSGIFPRGLGPFVPSPMPPALGPLFGAGLGFQELIRPPPSNTKLQQLDGFCGGGYGAGSMQDGGDGRLLFPFEDLKLVPMRNESHEAAVHGQGDPTLFWNGVMGNGSSSSNGGGAAGGSW